MDSMTWNFRFISVAIIVIIGLSVVCASLTSTQSDDNWDILLNRIALGEGTSEDAAKQYGFKSGYDILYGYNEPEDFDSKFSGKSLTEMTLGEIWELQTKMGRKNAVGRYQILSDTLFGTEDNGYYGLQDILGLSDDTLFDVATQERLAKALLERRGCSDWIDGEISDSQFQLNLAQEWASVPDPNTGRSYYGQNVGTTDAEIKEAMKQTKAKKAMQGTQQSAQGEREPSHEDTESSLGAYKSTIPIPTGSAAEALKEQGKYEEYLQNALQAAEKRIERDPQDKEAWYTKGLALFYLNRGAEADEALEKAGDLGIQFEFDGESFSGVSPESSPSIQQSSLKAQDESVPEEGSVAPKFYPSTSMLSDEDVLSSISRGLEPITQSITSSQSQSISKDFLKGDKVETTDLLNVRSVPGLPIDSTEDTRISEPMSKGSIGTILEGPVEADGFAWWKIQYNDGTIGWSQDKRLELQPIASSRTDPSAGKDESQSLSESDLGGVNFSSIKLNCISVSTDQRGDITLDIILKAQKAEGASPGIDIANSTSISAAALMTGLAVSDNKLWVNLNPWEPDRVIDEKLRKSDVGRIMLEADLQMKRDFSNYDNPCNNETGEIMWNLLDNKREALVQQCMKKFPGEIKEDGNVIFAPVTRHWITPDKVYAYFNGTKIFIINSTLTINSESAANHSSFQVKDQKIETLSKGCLEELNKSAKEFGEYAKEMSDRMIYPYVVADINNGEKYEDLRNVYIALALAQWYKSRIDPQSDVFQSSLGSSNSIVPISLKPWSYTDIWNRYVQSFEKGEYECWKNETIKRNATITALRNSSYLSGGVDFGDIGAKLVVMGEMPPEVQDLVNEAIMNGYAIDGGNAFFWLQIPYKQKKRSSGHWFQFRNVARHVVRDQG